MFCQFHLVETDFFFLYVINNFTEQQYSSKAAGNNDGIELMPGNFLCCLKVVKLEYSSYSIRPMESRLAKFLLRNAAELKEFLIYQQHMRHEADQVKNQLLKCSRGSSHVFILCI